MGSDRNWLMLPLLSSASPLHDLKDYFMTEGVAARLRRQREVSQSVIQSGANMKHHYWLLVSAPTFYAAQHSFISCLDYGHDLSQSLPCKLIQTGLRALPFVFGANMLSVRPLRHLESRQQIPLNPSAPYRI